MISIDYISLRNRKDIFNHKIKPFNIIPYIIASSVVATIASYISSLRIIDFSKYIDTDLSIYNFISIINSLYNFVQIIKRYSLYEKVIFR